MRASPQPRPIPWSVADAALATALVFAGFLVVWVLLGRVVGVVAEEQRTLLVPWVLGALEGLMLVAVWAFAVHKYGARWQVLGLRRPAGRAVVMPVVALLGSLGFAGVYFAIIAALGLDSFNSQGLPEDVFGHGATRLLNMVVVVGWAPFAEEVFFRGFLLAALLPSLGAVRAAALSSAVFAGAHMLPTAMIPLFVTSLLLSWLYVKTRSVWPPIATHVAQNLLVASMA
ncbi:MAG: CPBP family intramembrane metalloprotease [Chloroflexi bacterium]|nr:CPBP family intramembrane metalloprotease [Chloroflexota bacterium]